MNLAYTVAREEICSLPSPSPEEVVASVLNPDWARPEEKHVDLFATLNDRAEAVIKILDQLEVRTDYIGFARVPSGDWAIQKTSYRPWVFGPPIRLRACGQAILATLAAHGHEIPRDRIRVAYGMPYRWRPEDTMDEMGKGTGIYKGCVPDDIRVVGVPITNIGERWAIWIGAHINGARSGDDH